MTRHLTNKPNECCRLCDLVDVVMMMHWFAHGPAYRFVVQLEVELQVADKRQPKRTCTVYSGTL